MRTKVQEERRVVVAQFLLMVFMLAVLCTVPLWGQGGIESPAIVTTYTTMPIKETEIPTPEIQTRFMDKGVVQYSAGDAYPVFYVHGGYDELFTESFFTKVINHIPTDTYYSVEVQGNTICLTDNLSNHQYITDYTGLLLSDREATH